LAQKVGILPSFLFAFVLTGWLGMAGLTRKQFYRFKGQEFVLAARTLGASDWRLMFKHIFPNSLGTIITSCALVIPGVINSETSMTYLGIINLQETFGTSIGVLMSQGQTAMTSAPHAMIFPSIFISLLLISFNLFGNGLRDAFNPSMRGVDD
jgi:oligopeptide transport system permease protein